MGIFNQSETNTTPCPSLGPLEVDILKLIWKEHHCSVRCILVELNSTRSKKDKLAYTTVMTIMKRLLDKGLLKRNKEGRGYFYEPTRSESEFIASVVKRAISDVTSVYGKEALEVFKHQLQHH